MTNRRVPILLLLVIAIAIYALAIKNPRKADEAPVSPQEQAAGALKRYFALLNQGDFQSALDLHGSGFEWLAQANPDVSPEDRVELLRRGCTQNGLNCLKVKTIVNQAPGESGQFGFVVQFENPDGSTFRQGPCCGETEGPVMTDFTYWVKNINGQLTVSPGPVYTP
jgi:hypothetical protein